MFKRSARNPARVRHRLLGVSVLALGALLGLGTEAGPATHEPVVGELEITGPASRFEVDASVVGLRWDGDEGPDSARIRVSEDGSRWGEWTAVHDPEDHGPDPGSGEETGGPHTSEAVFVGNASWIEVRVDEVTPGLELVYVDTSGRSLPVWERLVDRVSSLEWAVGSRALASPDQPPIQPRAAWGGQACVGPDPDPLSYTRRVKVLFVHHTVHSASANAYTQSDVPGLLYAICQFHVAGNGWSDIAYNVLIDKFGTIWEGRGGSLDQGVIGAHTGGFNSYSTGVAFLGDHRLAAPSNEGRVAFVDYATWKLDVHHIDPIASGYVRSLGSSRYPAGTDVLLRSVSIHREVSTTTCPGDQLASLIDSMRAQMAAQGGTKIFGGWPDADPIQGFESSGYSLTAFPFRFTEPMAWTFTIVDQSGRELLRQTGSGPNGSVSWDGRVAGVHQPFGLYTARLDAVPDSGAPVPRPASFTFQLGSYLPPFADDEGSPHEADIGTIFDLGITTGCAGDLFCPQGDLARWQMALFLTRLQTAAGFPLPPAADSRFGDLDGYSADARIAIGQLAELGITAGVGEGRFDPAGVVSRWQMALFITRQLTAMGLTLPDGASQGFTDLGELPGTTQTAINQITQAGIARGTGDGLYAPNDAVTRAQMASFLARTMAIIGTSP